MERELERNATLYIPPRTPPVQPFQGPIFPSPPNLSPSPLPTFQRRSHSPAPSLASISTLSSSQSVPSSSAPSTSASQSSPGQRSTRSNRLGHLITGSSSQSSHSSGTIETVHAGPTPGAVRSTAAPTSQHRYDYPSELSTDDLVATCHAFIQRLRRGSSQVVIQRLNNVGPIPEDKALLSFWIAQVRLYDIICPPAPLTTPCTALTH